MTPQPHGTHLPPPSMVDVTVAEGSERSVFMLALDDSGEPWAGHERVPANIETNPTASGLEVCLVASFSWIHDGPSPRIAKVKVTGWSADNDYVLTPSGSGHRCWAKGESILVRIPTRILA